MATKEKTTRLRLRVRDGNLTRDKVIETVFLITEVPFIRIFGDSPVYTALCTDKDANKLLKEETKNKLKRKGIDLQTPIELKARRTVFVRRVDRHVGSHSPEEIKEEIEKNQPKPGRNDKQGGSG